MQTNEGAKRADAKKLQSSGESHGNVVFLPNYTIRKKSRQLVELVSSVRVGAFCMRVRPARVQQKKNKKAPNNAYIGARWRSPEATELDRPGEGFGPDQIRGRAGVMMNGIVAAFATWTSRPLGAMQAEPLHTLLMLSCSISTETQIHNTSTSPRWRCVVRL